MSLRTPWVILICGGRVRVEPARRVCLVLDFLAMHHWSGKVLTVVEGGAEGYDALGAAWARLRGHSHRRVRPDPHLDGYDDEAPKRRNIRMFETHQPDEVVVFPGGPGTRHMIAYALGRRPVLDVEFGTTDPGGFRINILTA